MNLKENMEASLIESELKYTLRHYDKGAEPKNRANRRILCGELATALYKSGENYNFIEGFEFRRVPVINYENGITTIVVHKGSSDNTDSGISTNGARHSNDPMYDENDYEVVWVDEDHNESTDVLSLLDYNNFGVSLEVGKTYKNYRDEEIKIVKVEEVSHPTPYGEDVTVKMYVDEKKHRYLGCGRRYSLKNNSSYKHITTESMAEALEQETQPQTKKEDIMPESKTEIPAKAEVKSEALEKVSATMKLLDIPDDVNIDNIVKSQHHAVGVAEYYKKRYEEFAEKGVVIPVKPKGTTGIVPSSWWDTVNTDIKLGRTIGLRGPAGNGKSTGAEEILKAAGYNVYHMDCTDSTTTEQLVGGLLPEPDGKGGLKMVFKEGIVNEAFNDPKGAIIFDEFDALDSRVGMALQSALHRAKTGKTRYVSSPDHPEGGQYAKGDCPIICTMNTFGSGATREYVGRNTIDSASLDRFDSIIDTNYENEGKIMVANGISAETATQVIKAVTPLRETINRKGMRVVLSTRRVMNIAESMESLGCTIDTALKRDFVNRLEVADREALGFKA